MKKLQAIIHVYIHNKYCDLINYYFIICIYIIIIILTLLFIIFFTAGRFVQDWEETASGQLQLADLQDHQQLLAVRCIKETHL